MNWWSSFWQTNASAWIDRPLKAAGQGSAAEPRDLEPGADYLSITLESMWIVGVRKGWTSYYGVVHSHCSLDTLRGTKCDVSVIISPNSLKGVDDAHLDRIVIGGSPLVWRIPFVGGTPTLEVGLVSVKGSDLAAPFIGLLETLTQTAGVSALSATLPLVSPIKQGFEGLLGTHDSILEIGSSRSLNPPRTGYRLIMRATERDLDASQLSYDPDSQRLRYDNGAIEDRFPFMVIKIEACREKDDFYNIPAIQSAYQALADAATSGESRRLPGLIDAFDRTARYSMDLLEADGSRLADKVSARFRTTRSAVAPVSRDIPDLKGIGLY